MTTSSTEKSRKQKTSAITIPGSDSEFLLKEFKEKIKAPYMLTENALKILHLCALVGPYENESSSSNNNSIDSQNSGISKGETTTTPTTLAWQKVYKSLYDEAAPNRLVKSMNSYVDNRTNTLLEDVEWRGIMGYFDTCTELKSMTASEFVNSDTSPSEIKNFVESTLFKNKEQKELIEATWNGADLAKSYLTVYTPKYDEIYKSILSNVKLNTVNNIKSYKSNNPYIDENALHHILSYLHH